MSGPRRSSRKRKTPAEAKTEANKKAKNASAEESKGWECEYDNCTEQALLYLEGEDSWFCTLHYGLIQRRGVPKCSKSGCFKPATVTAKKTKLNYCDKCLPKGNKKNYGLHTPECAICGEKKVVDLDFSYCYNHVPGCDGGGDDETGCENSAQFRTKDGANLCVFCDGSDEEVAMCCECKEAKSVIVLETKAYCELCRPVCSIQACEEDADREDDCGYLVCKKHKDAKMCDGKNCYEIGTLETEEGTFVCQQCYDNSGYNICNKCGHLTGRNALEEGVYRCNDCVCVCERCGEEEATVKIKEDYFCDKCKPMPIVSADCRQCNQKLLILQNGEQFCFVCALVDQKGGQECFDCKQKGNDRFWSFKDKRFRCKDCQVKFIQPPQADDEKKHDCCTSCGREFEKFDLIRVDGGICRGCKTNQENKKMACTNDRCPARYRKVEKISDDIYRCSYCIVGWNMLTKTRHKCSALGCEEMSTFLWGSVPYCSDKCMKKMKPIENCLCSICMRLMPAGLCKCEFTHCIKCCKKSAEKVAENIKTLKTAKTLLGL